MDIRIELGSGLYLKIENVRYTPVEPPFGLQTDGLASEATWDEEDCKIENHVTEYQAPEGFADDYYDLILEEVESFRRNI